MGEPDITKIKAKKDKRIEGLIRDLKHKDSLVRGPAALGLAGIGDARAVEPLIQALEDKDKDVRGAAAWALGLIRDARAVEPLIKALKDEGESDHVRAAAAMALGEIGDARAVEPLTQALKDKNRGVRKAAEEALEEIKAKEEMEKLVDRKGVGGLINALKNNEDRDIRRHAALALIKIGEPAVEPLIEALRDRDWNGQWAAEALAKIGEPAVKPLTQVLKDEDKRVRKVAKKALEKM